MLVFFANVPGDSFNEAGQLQGRTMPRAKPKPLIPHQSLHVYFM